ncbi:hypothetical protein ACIBLA_00655 [Streptomyces sp. NPDC050433]
MRRIVPVAGQGEVQQIRDLSSRFSAYGSEDGVELLRHNVAMAN